MKRKFNYKWECRSAMFILLLGAIVTTQAMAQTYINAPATPTNDIVNAETVGIIPYSDDFITQEEVMDRYYAITSYRMIDTATVAVLTGASNMIMVYSLNQNQILYKIQLPISAKAFEYDNNLFHVIGDRTYLTVDSEGIVHERKDFQRPNKDFFVITDLKIIDGQPIIHECDAETYTIASDRLQEIDAFYYHHARGSKIHPQYIDENSFVLYNETPTRSGNINVSMESLGLEGKLACLDCISVDDDHIAINLQTTYNRNGSFIKSYLLVVDPNGELINLVEVPINFLSYIHKSFLYKDNAWYYAFSGLEGISFFKIDMSTNRVDSPDPSILQDENIDYIYHEPENGTSFEDTNNGDPTRGNWRTITQVWYNANQYCIMDWTPIPDNIATECTWIGGSGGGYISTPIINYYYTETGVPYKWAGFTDRMSFVALASEGKKTGNIWTNRNSNFSCPGDAYSSDSDDYVIGVDCSGYVSNCWEVGHQGTSTIKNICSDYGYVINATSNSIFQSGDALTKEGDHVMLYRGHNSSNNKIQVFQASARDWKTSPYEYLTSYFSGYKIFRYNNMKNIILRLGSDIELRQNGSTVPNVTQGVPLTVNYSVKNFGNETWTGYVSLWIEKSNGTLECIQGEFQNGLTTLSAGSTQSFTFSNNGVSSPVGTTKFYVKVKNYNAGGYYGERNYDVGSLSNSNPLVFQIIEGGGGGSGHDCTEIPDYDFSRTVSTSWNTHSSSIEANCWKIYRFSVSPNYTYCFTTGCGGGAEADFDTKLYLYNQNGSLITSDDDGCSGSNKSIINYNSNSSGYVYLKVAGYSSSHGDYTLAYMKSSNCTTVPDYDYSRTVYTTWSTHSSSIEADCWKIYRFSVSPDYSYCFKTGCGDGAEADFDTYLYLYDQNGQELARNDDGCSGNTSKIDYESNSSGYVYLKVAGYGSSDYGDYTLAYIKESTVPTSYIISVSASPSIGGSVSGGGQYVNGNSCTLIASANTGYTFARWTKNGSQVSTSPTYTFTVTENASYVAVFTLNSYAITTSANPTAGGTVSSGGNFDHGSTCTLTATANTGYTFVRWTKNGSQVSTSPTYTFTVTENASYVAVFSLNSYTISASASPTAGGSVNGAGTYSHGSTCNLTASANIGYSFVNWTENGTQVSDNTNYTFVVNGNRNLMANFSLNSYDITTSVTPINGGRVTGLRVFWEELFEFTCSSGGQPAIATDGNFIYTASWQTTPIGGYTFYKYNLDGSFVEGFNISDVTCIRDLTYDGTYFYAGNGSTSIFQLDFNAKTLIRTINTTFNTRHCEYDPVNDGFWIGDWHTLYLVNRSGNVMLTGPAINGGYGAYGAAYYTADDNTPHLYLFCQSGSSNAQVVDYNINTNTLGAVLFDFENCPNYNNGNGSAGGAFIGEYNGKICFFGNAQQGNNLVAIYELKESSVGSYNYGENVTLTAMPNDGFHFVNWTENGTVISNDPTYSFTVTNDRTLVANFEGHPMPVEGLIAYYPFNGNANDESGYGNHGTLQGNAPQLTTDRFGNENSAYLFGGYDNSGYIFVPNSSSLQLDNAMSMSFWMNLNGYDGMDGWGSYSDNGNFAIICKEGDRNGFNATVNQNEDGKISIHSFNSNGSYEISTEQDYMLGQWLHCVFTVEDNVSKLYVNGVLQRDTIMSQVDFSNANNWDMYIGIMYAFWYPFNGKLDDIALYNRALSAQEVKQLCGLDEDLIAYYPFDGDANDYSGNDYHATPSNSYQYESGITDECISVVGQGYTGSSGGHVLLPQYDFSTYSGVSLSLWVNATGLTSSDGETYISLGDHSNQDGMYILQSPDAILFQYHETNLSIPYSDNYTGNWVMYTMTCGSDGKLKAYVNGTFVGEVDIEYDGQINTSLAALGRHWWYNGSTCSTRFTGSFDEVRIYGRVLTPTEVQMLYQNDYLIDIIATANPTDGGTVDGTGSYTLGQTCTLTATANEGYTFVNWTENGTEVSTNASYSFSVTGDRNLVANFELNTYDISATANPTDGGTVDGTGSYTLGQTCTLTATANEGYTFVNWTENGTEVSTNASYSFTVSSNRNLLANFLCNISASPSPTDGGIITGAGTYSIGDICELSVSTTECWHTYCKSDFNNALGSNVSNTPSWGYCYPTSVAAQYAGTDLTKVALFSDNMYRAVGGNYTLTIYFGGDTPDEATAISTMTVDVPSNLNAWVEYDLPNPVHINGNETVWVIWTANTTVSSWPAGLATGSEPNGSWWNAGNGWQQVSQYGVFTMKNHFTNRAGYHFVNWLENGVEVSTNPNYSFTVTGPRSLVANFAVDNPIEDLVAYYPFNGNTNDESGHNNHGTIVGNLELTTDRFGNTNSAYRFPGNPFNYVSVPDAEILHLNAFTLSAWVYSDFDDYGGGYLVNKGRDINNGSYHLTVRDVAGVVQYGGENGASVEENPDVNHWHLIAGTVEGDQARFYIDGILQDERTLSRPYSYNNTDPLVLGAHYYNGVNSSWAYTLRGVLDEVKIYRRVLSPIEIWNLYNLDGISITVAASPTEGGSVEGGGSFSNGETCTLTAIANPCHTFVNWTENGIQVSDDASYTFVVDGNRNLVANFIDDGFCCPITFDLHDSFGDGWNGNYLVVNYPDGSTQQLSVGSGYAASYTLQMEDLSHITLTWIAGSWISECSFTVSYSNGNVICYGSGLSSNYSYLFDVNCSEMPATTFDISAVSSPVGGGNITGTGTYPWNQTCTLTAAPNAEYVFNRWTKNGTEVSSNPTYSFTVTQDAEYIAEFQQVIFTHTQTLESGWNWWSTYIELDDNDGLTQLENSLGSAANLIKSRSDGFVESYQFNGSTQWFGNLSSISNEKMYKIDMNVVGNVGLTGYLAGNSSHPITISPGWNWIGYPLIQPEAVSDALSGFSPATDDILKGRNSYTTYYSADGQQMWFGTLNTLEPGCGYMYQSQASDVKTLMFQPSRGSSLLPNITPINNLYQPVEKPFADNMTMTAVMEIDGEELRSDSYELTAFVGNECRGSVKLLYVDPLDRYVAFLNVFGVTGDELEFRLTDGTERLVSYDRLIYSSDAVVGTLSNPKTLHFGTTGLNETSRLVQIFPNPVRQKGAIILSLPEASGSVVVEVNNMLGVTVYRYETVSEPTAMVHIKLPEKMLPGTYVLKTITHNGTIYYGKLVVEQ